MGLIKCVFTLTTDLKVKPCSRIYLTDHFFTSLPMRINPDLERYEPGPGLTALSELTLLQAQRRHLHPLPLPSSHKQLESLRWGLHPFLPKITNWQLFPAIGKHTCCSDVTPRGKGFTINLSLGPAPAFAPQAGRAPSQLPPPRGWRVPAALRRQHRSRFSQAGGESEHPACSSAAPFQIVHPVIIRHRKCLF